MAVKTMTVSTQKWENLGSLNSVTGTITSVADGDTFVCPLSQLQNVIVSPTTAVVVTPAISGQTITFKVATGTPTLIVTCFGKA